MESLSAFDKASLGMLFDPFQQAAIAHLDQPIADDTAAAEEKEESSLDDESKILVKKAIDLTESGNYEEALRIFDEALSKNGRNSATILNNRAQACRLAARNEDALRDLNEAVKWSCINKNGTVGERKVGRQALCQACCCVFLAEKMRR